LVSGWAEELSRFSIHEAYHRAVLDPRQAIRRGNAAAHTELRRYQAARALQVESFGDQIIEIGNREHLDPQDKRVRCDNLKWLMSKLLPKRYGDRLLVAGDTENPLHVLHQQARLNELTHEQLDALDGFTALIVEQQVVKPGS
jgi:hypothetical protein